MTRSGVLVVATVVLAVAGFALLDRATRRELSRSKVLLGSQVAADGTDSFGFGFYELSAGAKDWQSPHSEDEIYWIVRGRAVLRVADRDRPVQPGAVIYVAAGERHYFHQIAEDLAAMIFTPRASS